MGAELALKESCETEDYEVAIMLNEIEMVKVKLKEQDELNPVVKKIKENQKAEFWRVVSDRLGKKVDGSNEEDYLIPKPVFKEALEQSFEVSLRDLDKAFGISGNPIQPSQEYLPYSFIKKLPKLKDHLPKNRVEAPTATWFMFSSPSSTEEVDPREIEIINEGTSENTHRAYMGDLVYWSSWLAAIGFDFRSPITEDHIKEFIIQHAKGLEAEVDKRLLEHGYKKNLGCHKNSTINRRIASLSIFLSSSKWPNPCRNEEVKRLLKKLASKKGLSRSRGNAITREVLDDFLKTCEGKLIDLRDKALLLFTWASGGRRRSEVVQADMKDLTITPEGNYVYHMPRSKTDQEGKGSPVPINGRAANALTHWFNESGVKEGPIFRAIGKDGKVKASLSDIDVHRIVRRRAKSAGYDEKQYGAHSLRSGFVTEAGRQGKPLGDTMAMTKHKSVNTAMRYYQAGSITNNSAANLAG